MKKSKLMVIVVLAVAVSVVLAVTAWAGCEPPPYCGGCEGCTPGYWKQEHHFDSWVGYAPTDSFEGVFGSTWAELCYEGKFADDGTLLAALEARGHGSELCRHGVAALLNAASDVDYKYNVEWVLYLVEHGNAGALVEANEKYCPLN